MMNCTQWLNLICVAGLAAVAGGVSALQADDSRSPGLVALSLLQNDDLKQALDVLGEVVDHQVLLDEHNAADLSAAAGGLDRALAQRSTDEQYDLLRAWSLPGEGRTSVRILTTPVPPHAPPAEFARVLGARPRETVFPIAEVGGVRGLFCSGWVLARAADDIGRLSRLTAELEALVEQAVPQADVLLLLARLADARGDTQAVAEELKLRTIRLEASAADVDDSAGALDPGSLALAAAALEHKELQPAAEDLLRAMQEFTYGRPVPRLRQFLRMAHAIAVQRHRGESGPEILFANRLKYWVPVSGMTAAQHAAGGIDAMWLVHEDHILHLSGTGNDVLFFRYPLTGEFTFTCETQEGGEMGTDGGLVYGGLSFEALGSTAQLTVADADFAHPATRPCPFVRHEERPTFNRVSIRSSAEGPHFLANLHPVWNDSDAALASPWLGLRSVGDRRPVFRNFKLTGKPVIPREVHLTREGGSLRGWRSQFLGQTQPPFSTNENTVEARPANDADWSIDGGVIQANRQETSPSGTLQSLLCYHRPLLEGERISYEFRFTPDGLAVHPALGRLAFLIEPDGVRIHWITDGEREWTGLPADNATLEPLNRRGPAELPLNSDDWNSLSMALQDGRIALTLNDVLIYERPLDDDGDQMFGLYHDRARSAVRVRNVVMTGEWPDALPEEFLQNPATVSDGFSATADRHVLSRTIGHESLAESVRSIRRHAAQLVPAERFEFLSDWVLPSADHSDLRVSGMFTQTDPSPLAVPLITQPESRQRGAELVSPVFDLLDVTAELQRMKQLQERIAGIPPPATNSQQRALLALTALVAMELGEKKEAEAAIGKLHVLERDATPASLHDQWPETLVVARLLEEHQAFRLAGDLLLQLYEEPPSRSIPPGTEQRRTHISSWFARYRNAAAASHSTPVDLIPEGDWIPATRQRSGSRGRGNAHPIWARTADNEFLHLSGHQEDYLLYRSPLRGEFEFECDIGQIQVYQAGQFCSPTGSGKALYMGTFRRGAYLHPPIDPPFTKLDPWVRYRAVFRDGVCTVFVCGRKVYEIPLAEHSPPWIGVRSWWRGDAWLRDVRITGNPEVPQEVVLSALKDLTGWLPYFDETIGIDNATWQFSPDAQNGHQIVGNRTPQLAGTWSESLLRYMRPLAEDGSIEYEFFYQPGTAITHPALDRLAFLLDPAGVRLHWITDGRDDPTDVPPDNAVDEPGNRLGPHPLPLHENAWNHLMLSVTGETVALALNGEAIYQRKLERINQRTFGLFRYADTEVRVRNVVMRGDWPREVPPVSEQPLAHPLPARLNAQREQLKDVFTHDFADGLQTRYFELQNRHSQTVQPLPGIGLLTDVTSPGEWTQVTILPRFRLHGDFDVELRFDQANFGDTANDGRVLLMTRFAGSPATEGRVYRGRDRNQREVAVGQRVLVHGDGSRQYFSTTLNHYSQAGVLRLARRGQTLYCLMADEDSDMFRLIGRETVSDKSTMDNGIQLVTTANHAGRARVIYKNLTLHAERLTLPPPLGQPLQRPLFSMSPDGSNLQQVTLPLEGFTHLGSPEWSPDSRRIAFDMSRGSTTNSHIAVINRDGTEPQDLGPGCMPSFSADGTKIVMSQPGQGIVIMNADGSNRQVLDPGGWGAQWSPDGEWIVYGRSGNLVIVRPATGESREVLVGDQAQRYSYTYWNPGWSRDSRAIAFKGRHRQTGRDEVAIAHIDAPERFRVLYAGQESIQADFTWSPDDKQVLFCKQNNAHQGQALFVIDADARQQPTLLPGHPPDLKILNCAWSPDGKLIAFSSQLPPKQLEWPLPDSPTSLELND